MLITTVLAGRFTPAARVGVAARTLLLPSRNADSTIPLLTHVKPAWWNPAPDATWLARASPSLVFSPADSILSAMVFSDRSSILESRGFTATEAFRPISTADLLVSVNINA